MTYESILLWITGSCPPTNHWLGVHTIFWKSNWEANKKSFFIIIILNTKSLIYNVHLFFHGTSQIFLLLDL